MPPLGPRTAAVVLVGALLAAGCGGSDGQAAGGTSEPTVKTSASAQFGVPDTVTLTRRASYGPEDAQFLNVYAPDVEVPSPTGDTTRRPAILFVHGGAWSTGEPGVYHQLATHFATAGWVAVSVGYRLGATGTHPTAEDDVATAVAHVAGQAETWGLDPARLVLAGDSAGGHLAAVTALGDEVDVAALIAWSGLYDLAHVLGTTADTSDEWLAQQIADHLGCPDIDATACLEPVIDDASPVTLVSAGDPPTLLLHSVDDVVPLSDAKRMRDALSDAGVDVRLQTHPGDRHGLALTGASLEAVGAFLADALDLQATTSERP